MTVSIRNIYSDYSIVRSLSSRSVLSDYPFIVKEDVVGLASTLDMPMCLITCSSTHFMHVVAAVGTDLTLIHRDHAFSSRLVSNQDAIMVEDCSIDPAFRDNPYVLDGPQIRSYAGIPLTSADGDRLAWLCVADNQPRRFSPATTAAMVDCARAISRKLTDEVEEALLLNQLDADSLLQMLRAEPRTNQRRLVRLGEALYARLDQQG